MAQWRTGEHLLRTRQHFKGFSLSPPETLINSYCYFLHFTNGRTKQAQKSEATCLRSSHRWKTNHLKFKSSGMFWWVLTLSCTVSYSVFQDAGGQLSFLLQSSRKGLYLKAQEFCTSRKTFAKAGREARITDLESKVHGGKTSPLWVQCLQKMRILGLWGRKGVRGKAYFYSCCSSRQKPWWARAESHLLDTWPQAPLEVIKEHLTLSEGDRRRELLAMISPWGWGSTNQRTFPNVPGWKRISFREWNSLSRKSNKSSSVGLW